MQPAAMLRGLVNPRDSTESELGLWFAFLRDTVRNSMGLVAAEVNRTENKLAAYTTRARQPTSLGKCSIRMPSGRWLRRASREVHPTY